MSDSRYYSTKQFDRIRLKLERQNRVILFLSSALAAVLLTLFLRDDTFTHLQNYVMFLLYFAVGLWVTEAIPPFAVGILIVGFLVFTMGREESIDVNRYVQTWSDGVIWLFLGGFFLAEGMKKTRLDYKLLQYVVPKMGNLARYQLLGLMAITALTSSLMSNTATTAMMLATVGPLLSSSGKESGFSKSVLLGIPAAAAIGGMGTIIGSAPNAIAVGALESIGIRVSFVEWMMVGIPVALILTFLFWQVLIRYYKLKDMKFCIDLKPVLSEESNTEDEDNIKKKIVLSVLSATMFLWLTSQWTGIPVSAISGLPIVALTMLGIIDADDVRALPWDTLMLVAGGLALGLAVQEQGLADYFIRSIKSIQLNFFFLIFIFALITVTLSNFMSNTAATTILIPVAISMLSVTQDVHPAILPFVIGLSASCALMFPVSTPPNAIAFSTGLISQTDFRLGGWVIGISGPIVIIGVTLLYFYFLY